MKKILTIIALLIVTAAGYLGYDWWQYKTDTNQVNMSVNIYSWKDNNGIFHHSDKPPGKSTNHVNVTYGYKYTEPPLVLKIISKSEDTFTLVRNKVKKPNSAKPASAKQEATQANKVVIFTTSKCVYCKVAKKYFSNKNISYKEYNIEQSSEGKKKYSKLNANGVPIIIVNGKQINGFNKQAINKALN